MKYIYFIVSIVVKIELKDICLYFCWTTCKNYRDGKYYILSHSKKLGKKRWKTGNKDLNVSHRKCSVLLENLQQNELFLLDDIDDRVYRDTF